MFFSPKGIFCNCTHSYFEKEKLWGFIFTNKGLLICRGYSLWSQPVVCWTQLCIPESPVWRDSSGCNGNSTERSHFPSLTLLLFLFCKSGLRIKIHFDICLGHPGRESSHIEADGRIQITYLVTVVEIDVDKFANFGHLLLPHQA